MGKSVSSAINLQNISRITSEAFKSARFRKPQTKIQIPPKLKSSSNLSEQRIQPLMEGSAQRRNRIPLSEVVSDCVKRWFQDTLKEAKAGDTGMQVLVSQMYYSGYGVARDVQKGRAWMTKASRSRSSVWKVSEKHPGYNASDSDSDSDEAKGDTK